jgi:hypothetical protein
MTSPLFRLVPLALIVFALPAYAQANPTQQFQSALAFAAPFVGTLGALSVIGGIIGKAAGAPQANGALAAGALFIIATFLMKTYSSWASIFF